MFGLIFYSMSIVEIFSPNVGLIGRQDGDGRRAERRRFDGPAGSAGGTNCAGRGTAGGQEVVVRERSVKNNDKNSKKNLI